MGSDLSITSFNNSYIAPLKKLGYTTKAFEGFGTFFMTLTGKKINDSTEFIVKVFQYHEPLMRLEQVPRSLQYFKDLSERQIENSRIVNFTTIQVQDNMALLIRPRLERSLAQFAAFQQPSLDPAEKMFVFFQIAMTVNSLHSCNFAHGDLKPNNIFVKRNLLVYITDPAPFKPKTVDPSMPQIFNHYFVTDSYSGCYIAPERITKDQTNINEICSDLFSLGCILAFIYLNGKHLFSFQTLIQYKNGNFDLDAALEPIDNKTIIGYIKDMLQLDPNSRFESTKKIMNLFDTFFHRLSLTFEESASKRNLFETETETAFQTFKQLEQQCPVEYKILLFDYLEDQALKSTYVNSVVFPLIAFLSDFSKLFSDETKLAKVIPFFVCFLHCQVPMLHRTALSSILQMLKSIESIPQHFSDYIPFYLKPAILQLCNNSDEGTKLVLADILPSFFIPFKRLSPDSAKNFSTEFSSVFASTNFRIFKVFANSFKNLAKEGGFELFSSFLGIFYATLNHNNDEYFLEIISIIMCYLKSAKPDEIKKFKRITATNILPIPQGIINGRPSVNVLIHTIILMDYLLEHGFLENDTMYLLSRLASQYMFSQNTIIRYHVQKLINNLPPEIRQCNDYCFFFKRQNISAPRKNTKVNSKSERPKLQGTIKLKVPPKESIASRLTPRFVATFHSDLSPIKYIFANNDNTMCITINEANRVRWLSIYNENGSLVQPSQYRSHILRVQISSASILSSTHYLLGFENGAIESYEFKNEKKTVIIPPQNNNIHFTNIRPVDRNSTFLCSSSDRSISLIDTRSPESRSTLQYRQISDISDICFWSDRPLAAIGFSEGLVSFVDIRMFVPMYMTETSAVVNLSPAATNDDSSCAFFVQSDQKVELIKEPFTKVCLTCNGRFTQILPYFGGVLAIDDRAVTYIDSCEDRPSVTLYDGQKLICMRNDKILGMQPGNFQSLHMHQGKVTTAVHCGKVFVSGDTLGYTNVWSI